MSAIMVTEVKMTEEKIYTVKQVADLLQVEARTVRKMIAEGQLRAFRVRDEYRIRQSALNAIMKEEQQSDDRRQ